MKGIRRLTGLLLALVPALAGLAQADEGLAWQQQTDRWSVWQRLDKEALGETPQEGQTGEQGGALLVLFPGYSVQRSWAERWAEQLIASPVAGEVTETWVFAGPKSVFYENRELPITASLERLQQSRAFDRVIVVAHSSGSFPAHLWINQLASRAQLGERYRGRVDYANLDGGSGKGLEGGDLALGHAALALAGQWLSVSVHDRVTGSFSANHDAMIGLAKALPEVFTHRLLEVDSGCAANAGWCLHDVPINGRPHDQATFDLERDYTVFTSAHPVTTDWWPVPESE